MDETARAYIELAHAIERHTPGYIDGYFGPPELAQAAERPLAELERDAEQLGAAVGRLADPGRRAFLAPQVRAMQTSIALLQGQPIGYSDEVRRLYDVEPTSVPEAQFDAAIAALDELLPGQGDIATREQQLRAALEVPPERLLPLVDHIVAELHRRTLALFELPDDESFTVELVRNQPWSGYNWYLGQNRSRIDINVDLPKYVTDLPDLLAHEAYPGHHTEHAIKDQRLFRQQGRGEHAVLLINAPECVVSEGIATRALSVVMSADELRDWLKGDLVERAGLGGADVERVLAVRDAKRRLGGVNENAALLLHEQGASEGEVVAYLQRYRLARPEEARKSIEFLTHPNFRSYTFTYTKGGELLDRLFARGDTRRWFARLLTEPVSPATIREWAQTGGPAAADRSAE